MTAATDHFPSADREELDERPWLEPFVQDGDTDLEPARERYGMAMAACRAELRHRGQTAYSRMLTADGHETTALATHPKDNR